MRAHNLFVPGNWSDPVIILRGKPLPISSLIVGGSYSFTSCYLGTCICQYDSLPLHDY